MLNPAINSDLRRKAAARLPRAGAKLIFTKTIKTMKNLVENIAAIDHPAPAAIDRVRLIGSGALTNPIKR